MSRQVEAGELQSILASEKAIKLNTENVVRYLRDFQQTIEKHKKIIAELEEKLMLQHQILEDLKQKYYLLLARG